MGSLRKRTRFRIGVRAGSKRCETSGRSRKVSRRLSCPASSRSNAFSSAKPLNIISKSRDSESPMKVPSRDSAESSGVISRSRKLSRL